MKHNSERTIRILHMIASMDRGGAETYLINLMRRIDRERYRFDFCPTTDRPAHYDEEIRSLGGKVLPCPRGCGIRRYLRRLRAILKDGRYDVVHSHLYTFAGVQLTVARKLGVPHRFAHLHTSADSERTTLPRIVYRRAMKWQVRRHATRVLGCAGWALDAFLGEKWPSDPRNRVVYCGIDMDPFEGPADRHGVRQELGLERETPLIIHVGRFVSAKNHGVLIRVFQCLRQRRPDPHLLLIGSGPLMEEIKAQVDQQGLSTCVHFLGVRPDVPRLMKAADLMLMPSIREGLPLTMLEGTAAGLPIVITDMPGMREANEICCQARLLPMDTPVQRWADVVLDMLEAPRPDPARALQRMRESPFASEEAARIMAGIYRECLDR